MTQVDKLHAEGITGKGVKIGVVDSGIDYKHPALGGCFGPGCLVSYGYDFYGNGDDNDPRNPDPDPYDTCNGHGTHVAGIIAAQPNPHGLIGVAPGVSIGAYRITGCAMFVNEDLLVAGINKAFEDGSDIITVSSGIASPWSESAVAVTMQRIVEKGVICLAATSNNGNHGLFTVQSPATGHGVSAVAAVNNTMLPQVLSRAIFTVDSNNSTQSKQFGWTPGVVNQTLPPWGNVTLPVYALTRNTTVLDDACQPLPNDLPDLSNYIVLIRLGTCRYELKTQNAIERGAKRILFYSITEL
jgi:subtilisin family serine protease